MSWPEKRRNRQAYGGFIWLLSNCLRSFYSLAVTALRPKSRAMPFTKSVRQRWHIVVTLLWRACKALNAVGTFRGASFRYRAAGDGACSGRRDNTQGDKSEMWIERRDRSHSNVTHHCRDNHRNIFSCLRPLATFYLNRPMRIASREYSFSNPCILFFIDL